MKIFQQPPGSPRPTTTCHEPLVKFRPYQSDAFSNRTHGIEIWLWGRQTGKSFTLAAWAVDRLLTRPGRLVTILSNSRANGIELNAKCAEVCHSAKRAFQQADLSTDQTFDTMNLETRITVDGRSLLSALYDLRFPDSFLAAARPKGLKARPMTAWVGARPTSAGPGKEFPKHF